MIKKIFKYLGIAVAVIWLAGSVFIFSVAEPKMDCKASFVSYAVTWPLWKFLPDEYLTDIIRWSDDTCPEEANPDFE